MSTVSTSTGDINVKYQRLAAEFVKLRNQVPVLKNAVIEKQNENEKLKEEVQTKETSLRKLRSENESLAFRNDQLLKRIEALQQALDDTNAAFNAAKSKKKHKEANLRLFGETSRLQPSTSDTQTVLEQEFERKLLENGELHSKLFDLERQNESIVAELTQRINALEAENANLKSSLTRDTIARSHRIIHKSSDQHSDYYSDENPKEHLDNQVSEAPLHVDGITPQDEAKLYSNSLMTTSKNVIDSFVNLFTLFEQRCNIYPCDITLETLPAMIVKYAKSCVGFSSKFKEINDELDRTQNRIQEFSDLEELKSQAVKIQNALSEVISTSLDEFTLLFKQSIREECLVPWCNSHLERLNTQWEHGFIECLRQTSAFLKNEVDLCSQEKRVHLAEELDKLRVLFSDLKSSYSKKTFVENHLPTASKRLKCVNECIEKCLQQLATHFLRLHSMCSDYHALDLLAKTVNGSVIEEKPRRILPQEIAQQDQQVSSEERTNAVSVVKNEEDAAKIAELTEKLHSSEEKKESLKSQLDEAKRRIEELQNEKMIIETKLESIQAQLDVFKKRDENGLNEDVDRLSAWYNDQVEELTLQLQKAKTQAEYYKSECEALLRRTIFTLDQNAELENRITDGEKKNAQLNDDLETTRKNYELQLRTMSEHIAALNAKIVEQSDHISQLKAPPPQSPVENGSLKQNLRKIVRKN